MCFLCLQSNRVWWRGNGLSKAITSTICLTAQAQQIRESAEDFHLSVKITARQFVTLLYSQWLNRGSQNSCVK